MVAVQRSSVGNEPDSSGGIIGHFKSGYVHICDLSVAFTVVEAHGGRIWAEENQDGVGATFSFSLPAS